MEINKINKRLYEMAFIENGEYGYHGNEWHPSIDEREIKEHCEKDGVYVPATPCGFRDYKESRLQGLKNILDQYPFVDLTDDKKFKIKREDNVIKQYDKIKTDKNEYVIVGDDEDRFYAVDRNNEMFYMEYLIQAKI